MRVLIVSAAALLLTSTAAAQSRWTFSAGPEWTAVGPKDRLWSMRARAEYDLTRPDRVFGLRLEGAARWSPTQSYFYENGPYSVGGQEQRTDLMLGLKGVFSPLPRAPVSPYVTLGLYARQEWRSGFRSRRSGSEFVSGPAYPPTHGDLLVPVGIGIHARLGGRSFQIEYRRLYGSNGLTFGTRLPF